jgi:hypothetical protein
MSISLSLSLSGGWSESFELTLPTAPSPVTTHCDHQLAGAFEKKLVARAAYLQRLSSRTRRHGCESMYTEKGATMGRR